MTDNKDTLYASHEANHDGKVSPFQFDERVASVFSDMISRSVPSYQAILAMLPTLTREFRMPHRNYYDLGCSLGAGLHAMAEGLKPLPTTPNHSTLNPNNDSRDNSSNIEATLIGIDNSKAMLTRAKDYASPYTNLRLEFIEQDLLETQINNAAMVLMNFTLQFIAKESRDGIIDTIYQGLASGGALVLSEKITFAQPDTNQMMTNIHHRYKADQGYSQLEISQKRDAIENVLIPETLDAHTKRLKNAGFSIVTPWLQNLQFVSILAVK